MAETDRTEDLAVAWHDVVRFVRQLNHDLRNHLNAADLTAAYINELAHDPELKAEIKRLRETLSATASALQKLSAAIAQPRLQPIPYRASEFLEDLRKKAAADFSDQAAKVHWQTEPTDATLNIDPQLLQQALVELFSNAFRHNRGEGPLIASGKIDNQRFVFTLREPKSVFDRQTDKWAREPFQTVSPGHYGLGLNRARAIIEAHGGELRARYEPGESVLVTTITLPLSS